MEEDRPRARRGRVVPIQFVGPHQWQRTSKCSVAHCGRPPALAQQGRLRLANIKIRTYRKSQLSQDTEYGAPGRAPAHHRQNDDGTMERSSARRCSALARLLLSASALHEIRASYRTARLSFSLIALSCVWISPRPSPDVGGAGDAFVAHALHAACRLSAHDPKAVQDGQATTQDPQHRASGFSSRPATGARANLASTRDFITSSGRLQHHSPAGGYFV